MIGNTLSHYKIIEKLGAGGMGEVYLAEDSRLDRKVALKILPQHLSERAGLRERFEREARAVSSLNHPHICTLYDIGEQDGIHYLVMEHLVGETLEARLAKGALPLEKTLEYAIQIADALDKAHRQGVVHRDLKPANIMLVKSGAKLLDFGLAKLQAADTPTNLSALPTEQANLTAEGTILGTLQYMAPEQLEAKEADSRTDIFAFGAVVYEMATGKKAFEGKSQASLIAAIMGQDPRPMAELQPMMPQLLDWVVKRCLAKEPDGRWQSASDVMAGLRQATEVGTTMDSLPAVAAPAAWKRAIPWSITVMVLLLAAIAVWNLTRRGPKAITRFPILLPSTQQFSVAVRPLVALSPDGEHLVYAANNQLYLRAMDAFEATPIAGTEEGSGPFFSPDGEWVGFFAGGKLKKVSVSGGALLTLCDALDGRGASWGSDDTIIFAPSATSGLSQVSAAGGTPKVLTTPDREKGEGNHTWPAFLPDGKAVLFTVGRGGGSSNAQISLLQLETEERRVLIEGGAQPRYVPTGHLVYVQARTLMAVPFDLARRELIGAPLPIVEGVRQGGGYTTGGADFSFSTSGSLVYLPPVQQLDAEHTLVWVDREGATQPLAAPLRAYGHPRLSPDGRQLAVTIRGTTSDVWIYDIPLETLARLTFEGSNARPNWTPDGKWVTFRSSRAGHEQVFWKPADGSGAAEQLTTSEYVNYPRSWSPDGQVLAFVELHPINLPDIWVLPLEGERKPQLFLRTPFNEASPMFSLDGRWLAYHSNESGRFEIYVQPFPGPGGKRQISTEGGREPVWSRNGRELFYRIGDRVMAVDVTTEPSFIASTPRILFEGRYEKDSFRIINYDVAPDGQRFVMVKASKQAAQAQINVIQNWFEELKRLVPTDN